MTVKWTKKKDGETATITNAVTSICWQGSVSQVARTLALSVVNAPDDEYIKKLKLSIATGDIIRLYDDKEMIFYGEVQTIEKVSEAGTITYNAFDLLSHLLRSTGVYNFKNTTAEQIAKTVCNDFEIKTDVIEDTKANVKKMIIDNECIYDVIIKAYTKAAKQTGKKYIVRILGEKLSVREKGTIVKNLILSEEINITNASYQETTENMINIVKIYDDKGKQKGEVKNEDWIKRFGIYQQVYKTEKGINEKTAAKNMLIGIEKKVTVEAIEYNRDCIAGNGVKVHDTATKLNGLFWIESDTHTWENGNHTVSLELSFKNVMDNKE